MFVRGRRLYPVFESNQGEGAGGNAGAGTQGGEGSGTNANPGGQQGAGQVTFTAEQQEHLNKLIGTARSEGEKAGLTKAQQDADAERIREKELKKLKDAEAAGEYERAKTDLETRATAAETERDAKAKNLERANSVITAVLKERIAELESLKDEELSAEFAAITEPLDQIDWFNKASTKRAMANATEDKKVVDAQGKPKVPKTPKPNGDGKPEIKSLVNTKTF